MIANPLPSGAVSRWTKLSRTADSRPRGSVTSAWWRSDDKPTLEPATRASSSALDVPSR